MVFSKVYVSSLRRRLSYAYCAVSCLGVPSGMRDAPRWVLGSAPKLSRTGVYRRPKSTAARLALAILILTAPCLPVKEEVRINDHNNLIRLADLILGAPERGVFCEEPCRPIVL